VAEYTNTFWSTGSLDPRVYRTEAKPKEYRGFLLYKRLECCWDVVKDGACVGQYAGRSGAERFVDMLHGEGDPELVAFHRARAEKHNILCIQEAA
jgi:hypothetical protein